MTQVGVIISRIRDLVADPDADRWSDTRIIREINDAMLDIAKKTNLLRKKAAIGVDGALDTVALPSDTLKITRVLYQGYNLPFKSHEEMDSISTTWELEESDTPTLVVYDRLNRGSLKLYPRPTNSIKGLEVTEDYGIVVDIEGFTFNSDYGVLIDIMDPKENLVLYYIRKPVEVETTSDFIELDSSWDLAIGHYVSGMLLRSDGDAQNRAASNEALQLYSAYVMQAMKDTSLDFTIGGHYETSYRRF